jgi:hypothetical protein
MNKAKILDTLLAEMSKVLDKFVLRDTLVYCYEWDEASVSLAKRRVGQDPSERTTVLSFKIKGDYETLVFEHDDRIDALYDHLKNRTEVLMWAPYTAVLSSLTARNTKK